MTERKMFAGTVLVPILIGMIGFSHLMGQPRFATFHTVDVLQLLASGACFGIGFSALLAFLHRIRNTRAVK
jgi:hypothetical protein